MSTDVSSNAPANPRRGPAAAVPGPGGRSRGGHRPAPAKMSRESVTIIATLLVATFVVILNETIMNVALQRLMVDLGVDAPTVQWLSTGFMLTMAVVIPTTGFILQRLSTRAVFMLAMGLFSGGTLLAAVAPGLRSPAAGPHRPGRRHRHHAAAADDHHPHAGAAGTPRRRDGQRQHRHLGGAGTWAPRSPA